MHLGTPWGLEVILYLFLAGMGAGTITASASMLLRGGGGDGQYFSIARYGALVGPFPVVIGTVLLIFELGRPFRALNLYKVINLSPMSLGSWFLAFFIIISIIYALLFLPWPQWKGKRLSAWRRRLAWVCVPSGLSVAIYTGVLLGAMPSRPFWNSPIIAMLFMISAISTGMALIIFTRALFYKVHLDVPTEERSWHGSGYVLAATDVLLIGFELLVLFLLLMFAHLTVGSVKYAVEIILPGGELAVFFWVGVVLLGLVIPGIIEMFFVAPKLLYGGHYTAPRSIDIVVPLAVMVGGYLLRYVIVMAGQLTGPVGL